MADGKLVINKAGKYLSKLDKLTRIDKYVKQGKGGLKPAFKDSVKGIVRY